MHAMTFLRKQIASIPLSSDSDGEIQESGNQPFRLPAGEDVCFSGDAEMVPSISEIMARLRRLQPQTRPLKEELSSEGCLA
jgi:hypothetical protein